jgi:adenylate cyclase
MARQSFARAIELDPGYARAYAGVAVCDARLRSQFGVKIPVNDILANAAKALAIDPNLAEAHAARGLALAVAGSRAEAVSAFEQALSLGPNCHEANRYYAEFCVTNGQFEPAATYFQRALEIKPADYGAPMMLVNVFRSLGQVDRAEAFLGVRDRALEWLARSLATDPNDINIQYNAACTYALLGEIDRAIDLLETWMPQVGAEMRLWFKNDSDLDSIRDHPRYLKLVELSE